MTAAVVQQQHIKRVEPRLRKQIQESLEPAAGQPRQAQKEPIAGAWRNRPVQVAVLEAVLVGIGLVPRAVTRRRRTVCTPTRVSSIAHTSTGCAGIAGSMRWRRSAKVARKARPRQRFFDAPGARP